MQRAVLADFPNADISVSFIWIKMVAGDSRGQVEEIAATISDPRVQHFHDVHKLVGKAIARAIGARGKTAWDTYLFFAKEAVWQDTPPVPSAWMHQLGDKWAEPAHYHGGGDLVAQLHNGMTRFLS